MTGIRIAILVVAAFAAVGLALVVRGMVTPKRADPVEVAAPKPVAQVLVAKHDLAIGVRLTPADMTWQAWPVEGLNASFVTDGAAPALPAVMPDKAVQKVARAATDAVSATGPMQAFEGSIVREAMVAGEPIVARKVVRAGQSGFMAVVVQPGMRAMSISINAETAAGGFIRHFLISQGHHGRGLFAFDDNHAIGIAHHQVTRVYGDTTGGDWVVDAARYVLGGTGRIEAGTEHRETQIQNFQFVTNGAVHYDAGQANFLAGAKHQRAHQRRCLIALAVDHQNVARLGQGNGSVDHQVVTRTHFYGKGSAGHLHVLMHGRYAAVHRTATTGHVGKYGGLERSSLGDNVGVDALDITNNFGKLDHGVTTKGLEKKNEAHELRPQRQQQPTGS